MTPDMAIGDRRHSARRTLPWAIAVLVVAAMALFAAKQGPTGDVIVFLAAAKQADYHGAFPGNVYEAWELKPLGHRILWRGIYRTATLFAPFENKPLFELVVRLLYSLLVMAVMGATVWLARERLRESGISPPIAFAVLGLAFFCVNNWAHMQAEHSALLVAIPAAALALRPEAHARFAAGLLLSLLLPLKGVTLVMAPQVLLLLGAVPRAWRPPPWAALAGLGFGLCAIALLAVFLFPREISDLRLAAIWQGADRLDPVRIWHGLSAFLMSTSNGIAVVKLGIAAALTLLLLHARVGRRAATLIAASWLAGLAGILSQRFLFGYHFLLLWVPAVACVVLLARWCAQESNHAQVRRAAGLFGLLVLAMSVKVNPFSWLIPGVAIAWLACTALRPTLTGSLAAAAILLVATTLAGQKIPVVPPKARSRWAPNPVASWNQAYRLDREPFLLYLEDGKMAYILGARSWSRYFFPLPVQRSSQRKVLFKMPIARETLEHMLQYDGRYILHQFRWLQLDKVPKLESMIRSRYRVAARDTAAGVVLYERKPDTLDTP